MPPFLFPCIFVRSISFKSTILFLLIINKNRPYMTLFLFFVRSVLLANSFINFYLITLVINFRNIQFRLKVGEAKMLRT